MDVRLIKSNWNDLEQLDSVLCIVPKSIKFNLFKFRQNEANIVFTEVNDKVKDKNKKRRVFQCLIPPEMIQGNSEPGNENIHKIIKYAISHQIKTIAISLPPKTIDSTGFIQLLLDTIRNNDQIDIQSVFIITHDTESYNALYDGSYEFIKRTFSAKVQVRLSYIDYDSIARIIKKAAEQYSLKMDGKVKKEFIKSVNELITVRILSKKLRNVEDLFQAVFVEKDDSWIKIRTYIKNIIERNIESILHSWGIYLIVDDLIYKKGLDFTVKVKNIDYTDIIDYINTLLSSSKDKALIDMGSTILKIVNDEINDDLKSKIIEKIFNSIPDSVIAELEEYIYDELQIKLKISGLKCEIY